MRFQIAILIGVLCAITVGAGAQGGSTNIQSFLFSDPPGVKLRTVPIKSGTTLELSVTRASIGDVLEQIAIVTGAHIVVAPALKTRPPQTFSISRVDNVERLIELICEHFDIQQTELAPGLTLFSPLPLPASQPGEFNQHLRAQVNAERALKARVESTRSRFDPRDDPFVLYTLPREERKAVVPQSNWEKHEFNGHDVWEIPLPARDQSSR